MERSTSFLEHFIASHFCSTDTSADEDLDALSTQTHGVGYSHLDSSSIGNTTFNLTGNAVSDDVCIHLRTLNLEDIDLNVFLGHLLKLFLKFVNLSTALSDDEARTSSIDSYSDELEGSLDDDAAEACLCKTVAEIFANLVVLSDLLCVVTTAPVRVPTTGDTDSVADRICFLSHIIYSLLVVLHRERR